MADGDDTWADSTHTSRGVRVEARAVDRDMGGRAVLRDITLAAEPGEVLAVAGGSGSGKSILLDTLAGLRMPSAGEIRHDGAGPDPRGLGYVPQDDILHHALPLAHSLHYAAALRVPREPGRAGIEEVDAAVTHTLATLGLTARARQRVGTLSGGERKRASIAVELLTRPRVLFLDEPTSGLDPAAAAQLMCALRALAHEGTTVVLTTHAPADLTRCDRVAFLAPDGRLAYVGPPQAMPAHFGVETDADVYGAVAALGPDAAAGQAVPTIDETQGGGPDHAATQAPADPRTEHADELEEFDDFEEFDEFDEFEQADAASRSRSGRTHAARVPGALGQWRILARRDLDLITRDRLAAAMLLGSPLVIVAMFAMLFRPGAFDAAEPSPATSAMILFWIAFGGFFFGLTYGLLQICVELPIVRRERLTVLRVGPYVAAKFTVLLPVLALADIALLAVLRALDRLPAASWGVYTSLFTTLLLASAAALALGLLTSAAVTETGQAALMLPLLCFPQVLFAGAFVPVPQMPAIGHALSYAMTNRWAFEALGGGLDLPGRWADSHSPLGPPLLDSYGDSFARAPAFGWAVLAGFTVVFAAATCAVLTRRCPRAGAR